MQQQSFFSLAALSFPRPGGPSEDPTKPFCLPVGTRPIDVVVPDWSRNLTSPPER